MFNVASPSLTCKLYPNGEVTVGISSNPSPRKMPLLVPFYDPKTHGLFGDEAVRQKYLEHIIVGIENGWVDVGLSTPVNSTKKRRGERGITSLGKKYVRNAAFLMQKRYGRSRLSFGTVTVPECSKEEMDSICLNWSHIVHMFFKALKRVLARRGLPDLIVGVTEIQEKRLQKSPSLPLHLHFVFVGKQTRGSWRVTPFDLRGLWQRCLSGHISSASTFRASENIQAVRKDAGAYLGKYMSKGMKICSEVERMGKQHLLPSSWYSCPLHLRALLKRMIVSTKTLAAWLMDNRKMLNYMGQLLYFNEIKMVNRAGREVIVGMSGRLCSHLTWLITGERVDSLIVHMP